MIWIDIENIVRYGIKLTKDDWSPLITGAKRFAHLHASLKAFDWRLFRMIKKNIRQIVKMSTFEKWTSRPAAQRAITFHSVEEADEAVRSAGFDCELRQVEKGRFMSKQSTVQFGELTLSWQRFSRAFQTRLAVSPGMVMLVFSVSAGGDIFACGENVADNVLQIYPSGPELDITACSNAGSNMIHVPARRFASMTETLYPALGQTKKAAIIHGDTVRLQEIRRSIEMLVAHPESDPRHERASNLAAEAISWMADSNGQRVPKDTLVNGERRRVALKAREYIEEYYCHQILMEDLTRVTCVSIRTLQRCFLAYFQLSVSQYIKAARFNLARRRLLEANRSETTVTDIAMKSGFSHLGRFSVEYRDHFDQQPSETLLLRM